MIVRLRCQHCKNWVYVEDMGDNCVCPECNKFIISISEFIRKQVQGE